MGKKDQIFEWVFNEVVYYGKPWHVINVEGDPNKGKQVWEAIGMSEAEKNVAVADFYLFKLRVERDHRLQETDWVSGEDVPQSIKDEYFPYRERLRSITDHFNSIKTVQWPTLGQEVWPTPPFQPGT